MFTRSTPVKDDRNKSAVCRKSKELGSVSVQANAKSSSEGSIPCVSIVPPEYIICLSALATGLRHLLRPISIIYRLMVYLALHSCRAEHKELRRPLFL